ncbi:HGGxSTG domain-containing protein [Bacillus paranthracis]|uniref:HGGxSTG domain-containing protein n=1 Tax=Bacillus paranthracis TaxID=2026186 RepID=UPI0013D766A0|nr:HGGxSTG domain-containing protein [Bacillus paranthracis]
MSRDYDGRLGRKTDAEKRLISRIRTDAKKTVEEINGMAYDTARKNKVTAHIRNELKKVTIICGAVRADTGKICSNEPVEGSNRCAMHGGYSTGPVSEEGKKSALANLNPRAGLVHGLNSRFIMTQEENALYTGLMNHYIEELDLDPMNIIILHRAIMNLIMNERREIAKEGEILDESQSMNDYDSKFLRFAQALGMDRKFQVSTSHKDNQKDVNLNMLFDL